MLTRGEVKKVYLPEPEPQENEFSLEQRLAGKATTVGVWFKIVFFLLAAVFLNTFSFDGLLTGKIDLGVIITICLLLDTATVYANFISKTVVVCNPIDPLRLNEKLRYLYDRFDAEIKLYKERHDTKELCLVLDDDELTELSADQIELPTVGGKKNKLAIIMQLLANRYGKITIQSPTEVRGNLNRPNLFLATTSDCSNAMSELAESVPKGTPIFNYDSYFNGKDSCAKLVDALISPPRWIIIKLLPSLNLVSQSVTTAITIFNKIPNFNSAHWGVQIGLTLPAAGCIGVARVDTNNILKGNRAIFEAMVLWDKVKALSTCSLPTLQVGYLKAFGIVMVALASAGLTIYYNYTNAAFYSPEQAIGVLVKQLQVIPGIENTPDGLLSIGNVICELMKYSSRAQIASAVALSFLTSCKSTLDRTNAWLYKPAKPAKPFFQRSRADQLFMVANFLDSAAFGVNATFTVLKTSENLELALLTGIGIFVTNIIWGFDTKNTKIAYAIVRSGSMKHLVSLDSRSTLQDRLLESVPEEHSDGDVEQIIVVSESTPAVPIPGHASDLNPASMPVEAPSIHNARAVVFSTSLPMVSKDRNTLWGARSLQAAPVTVLAGNVNSQASDKVSRIRI